MFFILVARQGEFERVQLPCLDSTSGYTTISLCGNPRKRSSFIGSTCKRAKMDILESEQLNENHIVNIIKIIDDPNYITGPEVRKILIDLIIK